ncbi:ABC transporter permease [Pokkaliibacter plantistimulans]|uniref:ABC transporter permease n=2 Tax=Pseudomonadota TaxID=1224 RepID=A0ABX5LU00_9GAMM|nr:ABC transporter permease [Pokkaliibacter plantistimulans]PPC78755.1 ABC transporter permease [Pokkaliibacter plantistimulans]PXF28968.1 ABC transporter permease [Pokkaliibacter plantistimulans]
MDMDLITNILFAAVRTGTPLLLVAIGELICERAGVLNLGQEGMMLMGAVLGFIAALTTGSIVTGFVVAALAGVLMSLLFGFLALTLSTNQYATGLALAIFGGGLSAFIGQPFVGKPVDGLHAIVIPYLSDIPLIGKALFAQDGMVYLSFILVPALAWMLKNSRPGLIIRAAGESPDSLHALGHRVMMVRYLAVMFGGAMAGLAGGYLSLAYTPMWNEGMTAGRGWIALALVVFAGWQLGRLMLGAYLFGLASILHLVFQGLGFDISPSLLAMMPYVATILVLVVLSRSRDNPALQAPAAIGKPWRPVH